MTRNRITYRGVHESSAHAWQALIADRVRRGSGRDETVKEMEALRAQNRPGAVTGLDPRNKDMTIRYRVSAPTAQDNKKEEANA